MSAQTERQAYNWSDIFFQDSDIRNDQRKNTYTLICLMVSKLRIIKWNSREMLVFLVYNITFPTLSNYFQPIKIYQSAE